MNPQRRHRKRNKQENLTSEHEMTQEEAGHNIKYFTEGKGMKVYPVGAHQNWRRVLFDLDIPLLIFPRRVKVIL